jgi:hypothetical protein
VPTISGRGCWLAHDADAEIERHRAPGRDLVAVVGKFDVVGRIALPDREDDVDRLREHLVAILLEDAERLGIGRQRARAHSQDEASLRHVVEHRGMHGDQHGVHVGEVRGAGRELDPLRLRDQRGMEHHAVGDVLAGIGEMLAHEGVVESELVGEDDGLAILLQRLGPFPVHGMNRHGEVAQSHSCPPVSPQPGRPLGPLPKRRIMWPKSARSHKRLFAALVVPRLLQFDPSFRGAGFSPRAHSKSALADLDIQVPISTSPRSVRVPE